MKFLKFSLILSAFALFIVACNQATNTNNTANNAKTTANTNTQTTAPTDEIALGKTAYKESCAKCHQDNGTGGKVTVDGRTMKPDDLTSQKMKDMPDEKHIKYIENGIPDEGMPAFKGKLTDEQIKAIVKFIRKEIQAK